MTFTSASTSANVGRTRTQGDALPGNSTATAGIIIGTMNTTPPIRLAIMSRPMQPAIIAAPDTIAAPAIIRARSSSGCVPRRPMAASSTTLCASPSAMPVSPLAASRSPTVAGVTSTAVAVPACSSREISDDMPSSSMIRTMTTTIGRNSSRAVTCEPTRSSPTTVYSSCGSGKLTGGGKPATP